MTTPDYLIFPTDVFINNKYFSSLKGLIDTGAYPTFIDLSLVEQKFSKNNFSKIFEPYLTSSPKEKVEVSYKTRTTVKVELNIQDKTITASLRIAATEFEEVDRPYDILIAPDVFEQNKSKLLINFEGEKVDLL